MNTITITQIEPPKHCAGPWFKSKMGQLEGFGRSPEEAVGALVVKEEAKRLLDIKVTETVIVVGTALEGEYVRG